VRVEWEGRKRMVQEWVVDVFLCWACCLIVVYKGENVIFSVCV
jgi:hypothetical protein